MNPFFEGILLGFTLALFFGFGPAFFALIQTAIHRGFWKGFQLAVGVFLNDLFVVTVSVWGAHAIMNDVNSHKWFGIAGGVILIVFGIVSYKHKIEVEDPDPSSDIVKTAQPHFMVYLVKGFLLNIANPFVWLFWPTVVLGVAAPFTDTLTDIILFFSGTLSVVFLSDVTKVYLASKIKRYITDKFLITINKAAGIALIIFGVVLIIRSFISSGIITL